MSARLPGPAVVIFAGWTLDLDARSLTSPSGEPVHLTSAEFAILKALAASAGEAVSRDDLDQAVLPRARRAPEERTIDQMISRLRRKLGDHAKAPRLILVQRGVGYVLAGVGREGRPARAMPRRPGLQRIAAAIRAELRALDQADQATARIMRTVERELANA
jgi:DNA-binding winged helix-turn-helix (wHTH) protein